MEDLDSAIRAWSDDLEEQNRPRGRRRHDRYSPGPFACPIKALRDWLKASRIKDGAVFRPISKASRVLDRRLTDRVVVNIVKAHAQRIGLNGAKFSGHSLRSGFLTSAARCGASLFKMIDVSRHKSVETLRGYVRDAELFRDHAGSDLCGRRTADLLIAQAAVREVHKIAAPLAVKRPWEPKGFVFARFFSSQ